MTPPTHIGIDLGTSGCRAIAIDARRREVARAEVPLAAPVRVGGGGGGVEQAPQLWWETVTAAMDRLCAAIPCHTVRAIALDATSGTVLLADAAGDPVGPGLMYNDNRATAAAGFIAAVAPRESAAHGTASGLAKAFWLLAQRQGNPVRICTQADFITARLGAEPGVVDENNALKLGYDPLARRWPDWLHRLGLDERIFPRVVAPGAPMGRLLPELAARWGMSAPQLIAGTSDSTAAILATGVARHGEAVTSLGSTLVTKVVSDRPVFAPEFGVYSQPYRGRWLVGGGPSSGGAVLRRFFTDAQMAGMTPLLDFDRPTGLDYYPLLAPGERFPICDPALSPRMEPRPDDPLRFFQALLEGMARIEQLAYRRLAELGAPYPSSVCSVGGGARNEPWRRMRERLLEVPLLTPEHDDAAYGSALLAAEGAPADVEE